MTVDTSTEAVERMVDYMADQEEIGPAAFVEALVIERDALRAALVEEGK